MLAIILFLLFYFTNSEHPKYICHNTTVNLNPNEVIFFETYNFPNVLNYLNYNLPQCAITFQLEASSKNKKFTILITNPDSYLFYTFDIFYNQTFITWNNPFFVQQKLDFDFQGFAIHDESNFDNECFLESVANQMNPFHFDDETQILYIASTYSRVMQYPEAIIRKRSCNWRFSAPENYGFKVVILKLKIPSDVSLAVTNSTNHYIINKNTAKIKKAFYNEDSNLFVYLSPGNQTISSDIEFGALISIVKKKFEVVHQKCYLQIIKSVGKVTWTNIYKTNSNGYPNNAYCTYDLEILPHTMIMVVPSFRQYEKTEFEIDIVSYHDEQTDTFLPYDYKPKALLPYSNDDTTIKEMLWKFESDGSIRNKGFHIDFWTINCICSQYIWYVPCVGSSVFHLTNTSVSSIYSNAYCANMKCNFTIMLNPTCFEKFIVFYFFPETRIPIETDEFRLISDDRTVFHLNELNTINLKSFKLFLNPNSTHIFEVLTGNLNPLTPKLLYVSLMAHDPPIPMYTITLTKQKPYFVSDDISMYSNYYSFTIEIQNIPEFKNATIRIYAYANLLPILYTDETMSIFLQCDKKWHEDILQYCDLKTNKLFVILDGNFNFAIFRIISPELENDCVLHPDIFGIFKDQKTTFTALAGSRGPCKIICLIHNFYDLALSNVWTTASKNYVEVYTGNKNETLVFKFNKHTFNEWQNIALNPPVYIFEIPANSSIELIFKKFIIEDKIQPYEYRSIIQTPYYFSTNVLRFPKCFANFTIDENIFFTFTVTSYNVSPFMSFQFFVNEIIENMNEAGKFLTVTNASVMICYSSVTTDENYYPNNPGVIITYDVKLANQPVTQCLTTQTTVVPSTTAMTTTTESNGAQFFIYKTTLILLFFYPGGIMIT